MSNPRWVTAHGKRILIETLNYPPKDKVQGTKKHKPFRVD
jgi:hypothetical protein